jgi:hypothetical protein
MPPRSVANGYTSNAVHSERHGNPVQNGALPARDLGPRVGTKAGGIGDNIVRLYVDASYGVHKDGKSHTGSCVVI